MVRALGYQARTARDGREALRYIQQHPGEIRLVLTDVVMPYMDGGELAERARDLHPRLPIILMSAYPVGEIAELVAGLSRAALPGEALHHRDPAQVPGTHPGPAGSAGTPG